MTEVASVLYAREDIRRRVDELGRTITGEYVGREPVLVSVLTGGAMFLADLVRAIDLPLETHFMAISRYGGAEESRGRVQILLDVDVDLTDRDVILVEDIVDTGMTSRYLLSVLGSRQPATLEICTLLDRSVRRIVPLEPRFVGFGCPDAFVVGYGLDFMDRYRSIPDILRVNDLTALRADPDALAPLLTDAA
jgi:hypoxanthine phosphoribosyltransferase